MFRKVHLRSLAKINLDLRVLHKRADRFHELRTVFQTISLADSIHIEYEPAKKTELTLDDPLAIPDNLVLRAARVALQAMGVHARVRFRLRKHIPMGGGLGGGSSNAAAVLLALPVLAGQPLYRYEMAELGSALGSDVPFFLSGGTALGIGRGTELYPLRDLTPESLMIVCPKIHSSTATAYADLKREFAVDGVSNSDAFRAYVTLLGMGRSARRAGLLSANDFEAAVTRAHPELQAIPAKLQKLGGGLGQMSGSGSAFFGIFESRTHRDRALAEWRRGRAASPAFPAEIVTQRRYQAMWRRQLRDHITGEVAWP
ncbi:MAG: 4-(cytidine 5'-diphospho)-2-C-methyl-D-erythritol kinase, partial [Acidobacteriota bacterium]